MENIVGELLGKNATREQTRLCMMSIMSQCFNPILHQRRRKKSPDDELRPSPPPLDVDTAVLAEHVTTFGLAGIAKIRRENMKKARQNDKQ